MSLAGGSVQGSGSSGSSVDLNGAIEELCKSSSGVKLGPVHPGRPQDEEPHVKKTVKGKREISEYIVRVDQDELGLLEDEFDDLKDNFKMFDVDEDGVLNLMEVQHVLRCLGYKGFDAKSIKRIVAEVTIDQTHHSLSFNEYLTLISNNRRAQPSEENMIDAFGNFDTDNTGKITKQMFIQILKTKEVPEKDIQEMLDAYKNVKPPDVEEEDEENINYIEFVKMLTN